MDKAKVIVIAGPTASGKTSLSIELAKKINGEVISSDSMQIYKYMDIGIRGIKIPQCSLRRLCNHIPYVYADAGHGMQGGA